MPSASLRQLRGAAGTSLADHIDGGVLSGSAGSFTLTLPHDSAPPGDIEYFSPGRIGVAYSWPVVPLTLSSQPRTVVGSGVSMGIFLAPVLIHETGSALFPEAIAQSAQERRDSR